MLNPFAALPGILLQRVEQRMFPHRRLHLAILLIFVVAETFPGVPAPVYTRLTGIPDNGSPAGRTFALGFVTPDFSIGAAGHAGNHFRLGLHEDETAGAPFALRFPLHYQSFLPPHPWRAKMVKETAR